MTVEGSLRRFIRDELGVTTTVELTDDFPLIENGVIDSLGILEVVQFIEREFGVEVDDEDLVLDSFGTIARITLLVGAKRSA